MPGVSIRNEGVRNVGSKSVAAALCLTWALMASGMASSTHIESGIYADPTGVDLVSVWREEIEFQIQLSEDGRETRILKGKYRYLLLPSDQIRVIASSNDPAFVFGIMKYDWYWNGKAIVRKNPVTGKSTLFERKN